VREQFFRFPSDASHLQPAGSHRCDFSETDTRSCFSWGNTSRNQPTEPAITRIARRRLTEKLVTIPRSPMSGRRRAQSATPWALAVPQNRTTALLREARVQLFPCPSAVAFRHPALSSYDVNDREYNDPHGIDEVPIERQDVNSIHVLLFDLPHQRKCEHDCEAENANDHVKPCNPTNE